MFCALMIDVKSAKIPIITETIRLLSENNMEDRLKEVVVTFYRLFAELLDSCFEEPVEFLHYKFPRQTYLLEKYLT